jgi:hypothetical protein
MVSFKGLSAWLLGKEKSFPFPDEHLSIQLVQQLKATPLMKAAALALKEENWQSKKSLTSQ